MSSANTHPADQISAAVVIKLESINSSGELQLESEFP